MPRSLLDAFIDHRTDQTAIHSAPVLAVQRRRTLSLFAAIAACCTAVAAPGSIRAESKPDFSAASVETITVTAKPISHFLKTDANRKAFGKLAFRGGLVLTSPSSKFGGWSALEIDADGRRMLAISDIGMWMTGTLDYAGSTLSAMRDVKVGPLTGTGGATLSRERDRDAEGVVLVDGSLTRGSVLISFEQNHRIGRFPVSEHGVGAPTSYLTLPAEVRRQSPNKSLESVCIMRGGPHKGAVITLSERFPDRSGTRHTGWMLPAGTAATASAWSTLSIRNIDGFDLTDCRGLPDGSLLILERRFRWSTWYEGVKMRLRRIPAGEVAAGRLIEGEVLLEADMDSEIDNMEGLAVHKSAQGETVLTLISDNNFNNFLQRTILLQFTLADNVAKPKPVAAPAQ